jgi:hypothetical protein
LIKLFEPFAVAFENDIAPSRRRRYILDSPKPAEYSPRSDRPRKCLTRLGSIGRQAQIMLRLDSTAVQIPAR